MVDSHGQVSFFGRLAGPVIEYNENHSGLWSERDGELRLIARSGDATPGSPGHQFWRLGAESYQRLSVGPSGELAFYSDTVSDGDPSEFSSGLWFVEGGVPAQRLSQGEQAPGLTDGDRFGRFHYNGTPKIGRAGSLAFTHDLGESANANGGRTVWAGPTDGLRLVARHGEQAVGAPDGALYSYPGIHDQNDGGDVVFRASVSGVSGLGDSAYGVWATSDQSVRLVALGGDPAPGLDGVALDFLVNPSINDSGGVSFLSTLTGAGIHEGNNEAIWAERDGALTRIVRTGDHAPGGPDGADFGGSPRGRSLIDPTMDASGDLVFAAYLTGGDVDGSSLRGVWREASGELSLVARAGRTAPGIPDGAPLFDLWVNDVNAAGQIALTGYWGEGEDRQYGVWAQDRDGVLEAVALEGERIEVSPGEFRSIERLLYGAQVGDGGHIAFSASLDDGTSGVFVSSLLAIPEPNAVVLLLVGLAITNTARGVIPLRSTAE